MRFLKSIIENNVYLRKIAIRMNNRIEEGDNTCKIENVHSKDNKVYLGGMNNRFDADENCILRHCGFYVQGDNNIINIAQLTEFDGKNGQVIHISGTDNVIIIGSNCKITYTSFFINGDHNRIEIGDNNSFIYTYIHIEGNGNTVKVGSDCSFHGRPSYPNTLFSDEGKSILIHDDAMLAHGIRIRNTDSHCIFDASGNRINDAKDVVIGKHCWIGLDAVILKGAVVPNNCILAARTVCTHAFEKEHCIIGGNPSRIIKKGVTWERELSQPYADSQI